MYPKKDIQKCIISARKAKTLEIRKADSLLALAMIAFNAQYGEDEKG